MEHKYTRRIRGISRTVCNISCFTCTNGPLYTSSLHYNVRRKKKSFLHSRVFRHADCNRHVDRVPLSPIFKQCVLLKSQITAAACKRIIHILLNRFCIWFIALAYHPSAIATAVSCVNCTFVSLCSRLHRSQKFSVSPIITGGFTATFFRAQCVILNTIRFHSQSHQLAIYPFSTTPRCYKNSLPLTHHKQSPWPQPSFRLHLTFVPLHLLPLCRLYAVLQWLPPYHLLPQVPPPFIKHVLLLPHTQPCAP